MQYICKFVNKLINNNIYLKKASTMRRYTKKEIEKMMVSESRLFKVFEKRDLKLVEDDSNAYVEPSSDGISSLASDLTKTKTENPTDDKFIVNMNSYDNKTSNNPITIDVNGDSPSDASKKLQQMTKQPGVKQLLNTNTNVNAKVHLNKEHIERLRESSVSFSKKELNNLLIK